VIVLVTKANTIEAIRPLHGELLKALTNLGPREFVRLSAP